MTKDDEFSLKREMAVHGFTTYTSAFFETEEYKKLRNITIDLLPNKDIVFPQVKTLSIPKIKEEGRNIVLSHTNDIDLKVPFTYEDELKSILIERFPDGITETNMEEILTFINNKIELRHIFDIPVYSKINTETNGSINHEYFSNTDNIDFYKALQPIARHITLTGSIDSFTTGTYVHEMYHALSMRNKSYTNNALYNEFLSIFMEFVSAYDMDESLTKPAMTERLLLTKSNFLSLERTLFNEGENIDSIIDKTYILSSILAFSLFNTYLHSSNNGKKQIDNDINKVLMGEYQLEYVLNKYEVNEEKGSRVMKKQLKERIKL